jgi:hypothetical protein
MMLIQRRSIEHPVRWSRVKANNVRLFICISDTAFSAEALPYRASQALFSVCQALLLA